MTSLNLKDDDELSTVEIKVTQVRSGQVVMHQRYQVDPELAKILANDLTEVIAQLPEIDQQRITKHERQLKRLNGRPITRIDLTVQPAQPVPQPSFEQKFKLEEREAAGTSSVSPEGDASPGGVISPRGDASPQGET